MHTKSIGRSACIAVLALGGAVAVPAPLAAQSEAALAYDIPAQGLAETLRAIARASGREILFTPEAVEGIQAPAVQGRLTLGEALRSALSLSRLRAEYRAGAVLIREQPRTEAVPPGIQAGGSAITVTGTRIRGGGSASAAIVSTRKSLEDAGITDLAGFARILPQNFTGGQNPGIAGGGQQGGQSNINNSAALNLRGLGPDATLTLVNGHRMAYDALEQGIDLSAIPLGAIDRVEVVADGSSALYGSDAVGGVANIILRRDFASLETTGRLGTSTEGGNFQKQFTLLGGSRWSSGGLMAALDLSEASPIYADQRDYTHSLDPSLTLTLRNSQLSGLVTGHQQVAAGLAFELDGFAMKRRSLKQSPFLPNADVTANGLVSRPDVLSYAVTPTLRADLPSGWQGSLSATRAASRTRLDTTRYLNGAGSRSLLTYENRLSGIEATIEGPLFRAPGGDARLALGGGARRVALHVNITDIFPERTVEFRDFTERRRVGFAYGELSVPLAGPDAPLPLAKRLILTGALRYEHWEGIDAVTTPKLGIIYQPDSSVTLRGTWGRSFKAPTLNQVNQVVQGVLLPGFLFTPPQPPLAPGATVLLLGGGNPNLKSERASTWSATMEVAPRFLPGLDVQAGYFNVDYRDRIGSPLTGTLSALANPIFRDLVTLGPTLDQVNGLVASFPQGLSNQTGQPFDPASVGAIIDGSLRNTARQRIHGVDLAAQYGLEPGPGEQLLLTGAATYLESDQQLAANQVPFDMAGTIFNPPHWRGRLGGVWKRHSAGVAAFVNYVGATRDIRFPDVERVGPFVTLDIGFSLTSGAAAGALAGSELRLSALNLLDEKPDFIRNSQPEAPSYDSTNQSPVGRFLAVSVRKSW